MSNSVNLQQNVRSLGQRIMHNMLIVSLGSVLIKVLSLVFNIMTVRWLGEIGLGKYATVIAFASICSIFLDWGISQYVTRTIAQDRSKTAELFWNLLLLRSILAIIGLIVIPLAALLCGYSSDIVQGITLYAATFLFAAILAPLTSVLEAHERFDSSALVNVIGQVISIALGLFLLWRGYGFLGLLCIGFISMTAQILVSFYALRSNKLNSLPFHLSARSWPELLRSSIPFGVSSLALSLNFSADSVILSWYHSPELVGWYNAAYRLVFSVIGLGGGLLAVMTPSIAHEYVHSPERVYSWARTSVLWLLLFAIPAMFGVALLASELITLLFGSSFLGSEMALKVLSIDIPLLLLAAFFGNLAIAIGLEQKSARIYTWSVIINLVLNIVFIPRFDILAASAVTIVTDFIIIYSFLRLLEPYIHLRLILPKVMRILLASLCMAALVWVLQSWILGVTIVLAALFYAGLVWKLDIIDHQSRERIVRLLSRA